MKAIWKYPLTIGQEVAIEMPEGAVVLSVQEQNRVACMWAMVEPDKPKVTRNFTVFGTGHPIYSDRLDYIGTVQQFGGALVWHVFEILPPTVRGV